MQHDKSSFWSDIKDYEERLAKSPDSYCFARLSEVYLKVGLVDDALHTARQGVARHPAYLAGHRALALACHAKGMNDECIETLRRVTEAMPEDQLSQKLLGRLCNSIGDTSSARQAFLTVLDFDPEDAECLLELESLEGSGVAGFYGDSAEEFDDEEIIEDLEILEELDVYEEDEEDSDFQFQENAAAVPEAAPAVAVETQHDPLSTSTLAELYVAQGFIHKALDIYRAILADNPANSAVAARVTELELQDVPAASSIHDDYYEEETVAEAYSAAPVPADIQPFSGSFKSFPVEPEIPAFEEVAAQAEVVSIPPVSIARSEVPSCGTADNALATLEGWLDNIRRLKSCR